MARILSFIVLLIYSSSLLSQNNYRPGLIVKSNGDTVRGTIDYGNRYRNPYTIRFKADPPGSPELKYTPKELSYFEASGLDAYKTAIISKDMRPVEPAEINRDTRDTVETDTVFLRVLVAGRKYSLYRFTDFKNHFYFQVANGRLTELTYKVYLDATGDPQVLTYREALMEIAVENNMSSLRHDIDWAGYSEKYLSRVVMALNGNAPTVVYGAASKRAGTGPQPFISVGMSGTRFRVSGDKALAGMNYVTGIAPVFALGVDFLTPVNFNDFSFRIEIDYAQNTYKGSKNGLSPYNGDPTRETYMMEQRNITPCATILYNFRRPKKVKYYVGAGAGYNFSHYGTNRYTLTDQTGNSPGVITNGYLDVQDYWGSFFLKLGARVDRHWEVGVTGTFLGSFISLGDSKVVPTSYSLRVLWFMSTH
ncbi:MAG: hypothetical protein P4L51_19825 [Puia sp.]|nr:hypothetical protein [Puia sp.]